LHALIIEDEVTLAKYLKHALEEHGYAVDLAYSASEGLDWTFAGNYDVMILDVLLPGMDGLSLCRQLRSRNVRTPILMLTARDAIDDRVAGLDAGADDYLGKPFALRELLARLRALERRGTIHPLSTQIAFLDLTMDTATREVTRAGETVALTPKEFSVLECLIREPGRVLSRDSIAEHIWNYEVYNESNVIDVYIRNLRRKIDDPFPLKLIQTVRGSGYKLSSMNEDET
jgi:DNA-binding response OmpR family regulator